MIAVTALYLAGKVEEEHVRLTDAINVSYRLYIMNQWFHSSTGSFFFFSFFGKCMWYVIVTSNISSCEGNIAELTTIYKW